MDPYTALADPVRRRLIDLLAAHEHSVGALVAEVGLPQPTVSKQLRLLRDAGLVTVRPDGSRRHYSLHPAPLIAVHAWLDAHRRRWGRRLDALEQALDEDHPPDPRSP